MADDPNIEFHYIPERTMNGILYNGDDGLPRFSNRDGEINTILLPQGMGHPINICSSSKGLVACHNPISNIYYIWNPEYQDSYIALPKTPSPHNALITDVVLATEFHPQPAYHLICATLVDLDPFRYSINTYTSLIGRWFSYERMNVGGHIIPNTGVSCDFFAYWLTEAPRSVIRFDVYNPHMRWQTFPDNASHAGWGTRFQLGRVGNQLGLISVDNCLNPTITLYLHQEGFPSPWEQFSHVVTILDPNMLPLRPIRFESLKMEVFFRTNGGRLMIWEIYETQGMYGRLALLNAVGDHVADGFAHISSQHLPAHFPIVIA